MLVAMYHGYCDVAVITVTSAARTSKADAALFSNFCVALRRVSPIIYQKGLPIMSKQDKEVGGDGSATEAYGEDLEATGGAWAADYLAGPGSNRPALDGKVVPNKANQTRGDRILERRIRKLEKALREGKDVDERGRRKKPGKKTRRSPPPASSSSDSDSSLSSDRSASSSSSSPDKEKEKKTSSKKKRNKYDRKHQLGKEKAVKKPETIVVCLVKLLKECYGKGRTVTGLIDHLLVVAEKAETGYYQLDSLLGYDDECREIANREGLRSFGEIRPSTVLRFLCYDSTKGAKNQASGGPSHKKSASKGMCFKFNTDAGCDVNSCQFRHACVFCYETGHGSTSCKRGKGGSSGSSRRN